MITGVAVDASGACAHTPEFNKSLEVSLFIFCYSLFSINKSKIRTVVILASSACEKILQLIVLKSFENEDILQGKIIMETKSYKTRILQKMLFLPRILRNQIPTKIKHAYISDNLSIQR